MSSEQLLRVMDKIIDSVMGDLVCPRERLETHGLTWSNSPVCQKEVFAPTVVSARNVSKRPDFANVFAAQWNEDNPPQDRQSKGQPNVDDDIAMFKRIVQPLE